MKQIKRILTKQTYNMLKGYTFQQMSAFLLKLYNEAYDAGQQEGLTTREVEEAIMSVKGVGPKLTEEIMRVLLSRVDEEDGQKYACGNCGKDLTRYKEAKFCPHCAAELTWL